MEIAQSALPPWQPIEVTHWIETGALLIEILAVGIIVISVIGGTLAYVARTINRQDRSKNYTRYKTGLAKSMLLGLEILVAADVVRTVALEPSLTSVSVLGLLVLVRTFLSWSLVVETEGRWPWQQRRSEPSSPPEAAE